MFCERSNGKCRLLLLISVIIAAVILILFAYIQSQRPRSIVLDLPCTSNLRQLGGAIAIYAHGNEGQFPTPEKWCDLLISDGNVPADTFICPHSKAKKGQSSYAFNKNLVGIDFDTVGPDTIVLFETKPGWNQIAGPNSWNTANHGGKGCNVLYRNGEGSFERAPKGKGLKWTPSER